MKKIITAILLIASTQAFAQCGLFHCDIDADIPVSGITSSNNVGNNAYTGNGTLYEFSRDSTWKEYDYTGTIHVMTSVNMSDNANVFSNGFTFIDTLILHNYDTIQVNDSIRISYILNLGTGNCIVFSNPLTNWALFDNPITNFPIIPCQNQTTGIDPVIEQNKPKNARKGIYDMLGRKLDYEPLNQVFIKDGVKTVILK